MTTDAPEGAGGEASPLDDVIVVLDQPQDLINIAGVIRAMKNMGLSRLRLVRPAEFDAWRIEGIAHRSADVIERTETYDDLDEALADVTSVVGTSARSRTAQRNYVRPREGGPWIVSAAGKGTVAVLFGREDRGLSNEALDRCHRVVVIPTDPEYRSINLAQACLIVAYEAFLAAGEAQALPRGRRSTRPATHAELESMFAVLEDGLGRIQFFKARRPVAVMRTLRTALARAELDLRESRLLRAIGFEIGHYLDRVGVGTGGSRASAPRRRR